MYNLGLMLINPNSLIYIIRMINDTSEKSNRGQTLAYLQVLIVIRKEYMSLKT